MSPILQSEKFRSCEMNLFVKIKSAWKIKGEGSKWFYFIKKILTDYVKISRGYTLFVFYCIFVNKFIQNFLLVPSTPPPPLSTCHHYSQYISHSYNFMFNYLSMLKKIVFPTTTQAQCYTYSSKIKYHEPWLKTGHPALS